MWSFLNKLKSTGCVYDYLQRILNETQLRVTIIAQHAFSKTRISVRK